MNIKDHLDQIREVNREKELCDKNIQTLIENQPLNFDAIAMESKNKKICFQVPNEMLSRIHYDLIVHFTQRAEELMKIGERLIKSK